MRPSSRRLIVFYPLISGFFLCSVFSVCSVVPSLAQDHSSPVIDQAQIDWLPRAAFLERKIANGTTEEKRTALFEIRNLQTERASGLAVPALKDAADIVRATAASSVVFLSKDAAVASLTPLLSDRSAFVRREAAYALGKVKDGTGAEDLWKCYRDENDREVRSAIVMALGDIGTTRAVEYLYSVLKDSKGEEDEFLLRSSARSIGQIAEAARSGRGNIETLEKLYDEEERKTLDYAEVFRSFGAAAKELRQILGDRNSGDDVRREAAFALGEIGDLAAVPILTANVTAEDPYLAERCKEALEKLRSIKPL